jgi:hypothetical protein
MAAKKTTKKKTTKKPATKPAAKKPAVKKPAVGKKAGPKVAPAEVDLASFPEDLRAAAREVAPFVKRLRTLAAEHPKAISVGPPIPRARVVALAKHYKASLLPDYTALMMLADGIRVEDSYRLFGIDELMGAKLTKRSEKLRSGYSDCLPVGLFSLSGGWLFVMAGWGEPYCEKVMGMKYQHTTIKPWLEQLVKDAKKLSR